MKPSRKWAINQGLLAATSLVCLLLLEFGARLVLYPGDYLKPVLIRHPELGHAVEPGSGGHDQLGFRNRTVPDRADILAIGDSMTYGVRAPAHSSWPAHLARMTGLTVYNAGLGAYGPVRYLRIMKKLVPGIQPRICIVGLYLGNDIQDAHDFLNEKTDLLTWQEKEKRGWSRTRAVKEWLKAHSVAYRALVENLGARLVALYRSSRVREEAGGLTLLKDREGRVITALDVRHRYVGLNLERPKVRSGLELTKEYLGRLRELADESGLKLLVIVIPTKIRVFEDWLTPEMKKDDLLLRLLRDEARIHAELTRAMDRLGLAYVDPLSALRAGVKVEQLYLRNQDGHPNGNGYRVIAEAVADRLSDLGWTEK